MMTESKDPTDKATGKAAKVRERPARQRSDAAAPREIGGPKGPEPTRYGDWERNGRCSDF